MKSPRKALIVSYVLYWLAVVLLVVAIMAISINAKPALQAVSDAQKGEQVENPVVPQTVQEAVENVPSEQPEAADPVSVPTAPADTAAPVKQEGGHIPFTSDPVTPGDPESYVDTVGQCPFYEMAGPKGCVPPPDIECNADWSQCSLKEQ